MLRWDIFCKVIDNYGDIGVAWRLARQLTVEYKQNVRLWLDDVATLAAIWPEINPNLDMQIVSDIAVIRWQNDFDWNSINVADVVIETFSCHIPTEYFNALMVKKAMTGDLSYWFNLEYLTAEKWATECHLMSSPQNGGLNRIFYFPGFDEKSGGLLREKNIINRKNAHNKTLSWAGITGFKSVQKAFKITLFGYERMPLVDWLPLLINSDTPIQLAVTSGQATQSLKEAWMRLGYSPAFFQGALEVRFLPMLNQDGFDKLLWSSDLNFVRGEDSWVRAVWSELPFVWHIYEQTDGVHWNKLSAFMTQYQGLDSWRDFMLCWNGDKHIHIVDAWLALRNDWSQIVEHAKQQSIKLAQLEDLVQQLVHRCGVYRQKPL